ncbi:peroxisomal carnitine O-octanoyltransferase-like [Portunus trituberculatus]|uniref:peroxisomal carnitine O-octanoyltransferase-like n=1 Tax=Portunus trituberculatus TaxID=210409 RepID=UPI001E1CC3D2|nr:peroxisomal carnitine O-octanoyltransferase-like [Portunus trituberculatus]
MAPLEREKAIIFVVVNRTQVHKLYKGPSPPVPTVPLSAPSPPSPPNPPKLARGRGVKLDHNYHHHNHHNHHHHHECTGRQGAPSETPKDPPHVATYHSVPGEEGVGGGKTFQYESSLPSLPVPALEDTLELYLASVEPHLSPEEMQTTRAIVNRFAGGLGPHLQKTEGETGAEEELELFFTPQSSHSPHRALIHPTELSSTPQSSHSHHRALIHTTELSFTPHSSYPPHRALIHTTELSFTPQSSHSPHRALIHPTELSSTPQSSQPHHRALIHTTELSSTPQSSHPHHRALIHTTELLSTPQSSHSPHRALIHTTELLFTPQSSHPHHRALIHTTELSSTPQSSYPPHRALFHTTELSSTPQSSHSPHRALNHTTELSFTPQSSHSPHRALIHTTELSSTPQSSHSPHRALFHTTELLSTPQSSQPHHNALFLQLEDWWMQKAYLTFREPLLPCMNTAGPHPLTMTRWKPSLDCAFQRGGLYLWAVLYFYQLLREERFKPHMNRKGEPLSMEQFRWLFNCTRIPGQNVDSLRHCWKSKEEGECPQHVVVLCQGHVWCLDPWDAKGEPLTPPELEAQLKEVWERCGLMGPGEGVAALTCDKREVWAENRDWLKSLSFENMKNLELIETAAFVFVVDETCPATQQEAVWEALCGDATNRWADKSMSAILTRNGYIFSNNDTTTYDAMVTVLTTHYQLLLLEHMGGRWDGEGVRASLPPPKQLRFDVDGKLVNAISTAKETSQAYTSNISTHPFFFTDFGRKHLRPHHLHPDSFVQMALQLAYLRLHGRPAPTYETASTRRFYHGRTETIRSCTTEAVSWARAMLDPAAPGSERRQKLYKAIEKHNQLRERCEDSRGVDRHLLGLYLLAVEEGDVPEIFSDPAFAKSGGGGNYALSTSIVGYTDAYGGVAAMTPDGYGCFYSIQLDRISFIVTSFVSSEQSDGSQFSEAVRQSLREMWEVVVAPRSAL